MSHLPEKRGSARVIVVCGVGVTACVSCVSLIPTRLVIQKDRFGCRVFGFLG